MAKEKKKTKIRKKAAAKKPSSSAKLKIKAEKRKIFGRQVKKLRAKNILPANVYGKEVKSQALQLELKEFLAVYKGVGETGVVELIVGREKESRPVLIHNLQLDRLSGQPLHVDFHQIDLKKKVQVSIPLELKGEAPAVDKGGILVHLLDEIEVEALPGDLPEKFEVDIKKIKEIGDSITVKELKVDKEKVKLLVEDEDEPVVMVQQPKEEEEEVKPAEEEAVETEKEKETAEEKPVAGKEGAEEEQAEDQPNQKPPKEKKN